jgi:hypothetical protein
MATSRGYLTVIQYYNAIQVSAEPVGSIPQYIGSADARIAL